ncbi:MAG: hypothetical protein LBR24_03995, partial [Methanobrevibacter sp.]|nr:hypothetical protein [Methanobrevibacter sp.]
KAKIISGLQGYVSDDDPTPLPPQELAGDVDIALNNGAYGFCIFRFGLFNYIDNLDNNTNNSSTQYSNSVEDDFVLNENSDNIISYRTGFPLLFLLLLLVCGFYSWKR